MKTSKQASYRVRKDNCHKTLINIKENNLLANTECEMVEENGLKCRIWQGSWKSHCECDRHSQDNSDKTSELVLTLLTCIEMEPVPHRGSHTMCPGQTFAILKPHNHDVATMNTLDRSYANFQHPEILQIRTTDNQYCRLIVQVLTVTNSILKSNKS